MFIDGKDGRLGVMGRVSDANAIERPEPTVVELTKQLVAQTMELEERSMQIAQAVGPARPEAPQQIVKEDRDPSLVGELTVLAQRMAISNNRLRMVCERFGL